MSARLAVYLSSSILLASIPQVIRRLFFGGAPINAELITWMDDGLHSFPQFAAALICAALNPAADVTTLARISMAYVFFRACYTGAVLTVVCSAFLLFFFADHLQRVPLALVGWHGVSLILLWEAFLCWHYNEVHVEW